MIDLNKLEAERQSAHFDKADLFDFYHANWDKLVAEIERLRPKPKEYSHGEAMAKTMPSLTAWRTEEFATGEVRMPALRAKPGHPEYDPE